MFLLVCIAAVLSISYTDGQMAYDSPKLTWNTQGAKWDDVSSLLNANSAVDVLALQECGNPNQQAILTVRAQCNGANSRKCSNNIPFDRPNQSIDGPYITFFHTDRGHGPPPSGSNSATEYTFRVGTATRGRDFYLYHYELPNARNARTNLAILSELRAHEVLIMIENGVRRPVIGIRIGKRFYYSIHAGAFPTNPSDVTVNQIEQQLKRQLGDVSFVIMGDFNKEPNQNNPVQVDGINIAKIAPNGPTQRSGGTLDYAFIGTKATGNLPQLTATTISGRPSDHYPVRFNP